ncbi:hypothetical protein [Flavobacterium sp. ACN6]|uniref:hypothetical protein n=1 Tax=Flavobacterium sp. ACN6 TaxID=1920426 RepID=UPI000BB37009|nr:hypothetical protein [Flavobacterium sp. ACN6]PBJ11684.1 hypothetical protein BSF42_24110 [Flavobacterium sp. ACN6]
MESNETKNLDHLKKLTSLYFRTLKPSNDQTEVNVAQIKFLNYAELGYVITDMLKLCILALDQDANKISGTNKSQSINVSLILETILQLIPLDEFELLSEINYMISADSKIINDKQKPFSKL